MTPKITEVSWETYSKKVYLLSQAILSSKKKYDCIYSIPRGGLVAGCMISHLLNIRLVVSISDVITHNVLIVDDIVCTGKSIQKYINLFDIAAVYCRINIKKKPLFYGAIADVNEWIKFPYECSVNDPISEINMEDRIK